MFHLNLSIVAFCCASVVSAVELGAAEIQMEPRGYYRHGSIGSAEIVAHDPITQRLFVVNGSSHAVDVLDVSDTNSLKLYERVRIDADEATPTHVHVHRGIVAVALAPANVQLPGSVVFLDVEGTELSRVEVGFLPDMLSFTPDGNHVVVACEGEPSADNVLDPEGSVAVIDLARGVQNLDPSCVTRIGFEKFYDPNSLPPGMRILRQGYVPQDLEPEYLTISLDGTKAWVVLQENNALAIVDLRQKRVERLVGLGYKDHGRRANAVDACSADKKADIRTWPLLGMYQPDAIASFEHNRSVYLVTANEGDSRAYEKVLVKDIKLDPAAFPNAEELQSPEQLGNLLTTSVSGDTDGDGDHDVIFTYGGRSFSIWTADGDLVYDSGNELEQKTAEILGDKFNSDQTVTGSFDQRSSVSGPEPECVDVGMVGGKRFAFIGLERVGGIVAYDISDPHAPSFAGYVNTVAVSGTGEYRQLTDSGPEGVRFIAAQESPSGKALLAVAFEVSGTTRIYELSLTQNESTSVK